jgi:hypothetical protein
LLEPLAASMPLSGSETANVRHFEALQSAAHAVSSL